MALISNIIIDNIAQTAVLNITLNSDTVENITFDNATNLLTSQERGELFVDGIDFLDYMEQIKIFEVAILFNFSTNNTQTLPYNQIITNNTLDTGVNQWNLTVSSGEEPLILEYSAILSQIQVMMHKRGNSKTIQYAEWLRVLYSLKIYQIQIRDYLGL